MLYRHYGSRLSSIANVLLTFTLIWSYLLYSVQHRWGCTQALRHGHSPRQPYPANTSVNLHLYAWISDVMRGKSFDSIR
jgi:hypothetical protein